MSAARPARRTAFDITLVAVATLAALAPACRPADDAPPPAPAVRRDSGGIAIVENRAPAWGEAARWTVDSVPLFVPAVADTSPTAAFEHLLNVYRLADSTVVTLDRGAPFVRAFRASGALRWSAIAQGGGPGELRRPALLSRIRGDSLVVDDGAGPRALLLAPDGTVAGTLPPRVVPVGDGAGQRPVAAILRLADGGALAFAATFVREEMEGTGIVTPRVPFYLVARNGGVTELGRWPFLTTAQRSAPSVHVVFGAQAAFAATTDGFVYGFPTDGELRMYDGAGTLRTLLRTPGDRRAATDAEIAVGRARLTQATASPRRAARPVDDVLVDSLPAYGRVVAATDGVLWRERFDPAAPPAGHGLARTDASARWDVHDATGAWLGAVTMPPGFYLTDAGADWVAGIHTDDNDVQTPRVYALRRR